VDGVFESRKTGASKEPPTIGEEYPVQVPCVPERGHPSERTPLSCTHREAVKVARVSDKDEDNDPFVAAEADEDVVEHALVDMNSEREKF